MRDIRARRKKHGESTQPWRDVLANAVMGGTSRACAVTLLCPITLVKTRMEASGAAAARFAYQSVPDALSSIVRTEGARALWQGLAPGLLSTVPFSTLHYVIYRQMQASTLDRVSPTPSPSPTDPRDRHRQASFLDRFGEGTALNFGCGAAASVLATLITQPFDVMRTRAMLNLPVLTTAGLFAGVGPRLAKRSLQTAVLWTMYEEVRRLR
eukprot:2167529-Prymnesium_polylepis.1